MTDLPNDDHPDVGDDLDDDDDTDQAQPHGRRGRRLERSRESWQQRAAAAETELAEIQKEVAALKAQIGSVAELRTSLLHTAIRARAATMVTPEAIPDVIALLETTDLIVGDDGTVDQAKVAAALEELVKVRPYLLPQAGSAPRPLPGGHRPPPNGTTHGDMNDLIRSAAHGGGY